MVKREDELWGFLIHLEEVCSVPDAFHSKGS
jgi:hypothetical protein